MLWQRKQVSNVEDLKKGYLRILNDARTHQEGIRNLNKTTMIRAITLKIRIKVIQGKNQVVAIQVFLLLTMKNIGSASFYVSSKENNYSNHPSNNHSPKRISLLETSIVQQLLILRARNVWVKHTQLLKLLRTCIIILPEHSMLAHPSLLEALKMCSWQSGLAALFVACLLHFCKIKLRYLSLFS